MNIETVDLHIDNFPPGIEKGELRTVAFGLGNPAFLIEFGVNDVGEASIDITMSGLGDNEEIAEILEEVSGTLTYLVEMIREQRTA